MPRLDSICGLLMCALLMPALSSCDTVTGPAPASFDSACERIVVQGGGWYLQGEWSPDGRKVAATTAFDAYGRYSRGLHIVDVRTGHEERVASFDEIGFPFDIRWNPKPGSTLLLLDYGLGQAAYDYSSKAWFPLHIGLSRNTDLIWSPEGDSIFFNRGHTHADPPDVKGLHVMHFDRSGLHQFHAEHETPFFPNGPVRFSPDGQWMAYRENIRAPNGFGTLFNEVALIGRDGRRHRTLTHLRGDVGNIQWIRGGRALLFTYREAECVMVGGNTPVKTMIVDVETGRVAPWRVELTDQRYQFGWNFTLDASGERALVVKRDPTYRFEYEGIHYTIGALFVTSIDGGKAVRLVRSSGPPPADSQVGGPSPNDLFGPPRELPRQPH